MGKEIPEYDQDTKTPEDISIKSRELLARFKGGYKLKDLDAGYFGIYSKKHKKRVALINPDNADLVDILKGLLQC